MAMKLWSVGTANATNTDFDNDALKNCVERNVTHTSPYKADTDGDHIKDGNEDFDDDGVDNTDEGKVGTQLGDADTDNDGIEDADGDGTDNEDEDDQHNSADECAPGVEGDADEDSDEDDFGDDANDSDTDGDEDDQSEDEQ
jgi:hypothetical protein